MNLQNPSPIRTLKRANEIAGSLGKPSKMPGHAYGLSAELCGVGSRLRSVEGSTCSGCYAMGANYRYPSVVKGHAKREAAITHPEWEDAMVFLIWKAESPINGGEGYFRWHDSGDLRSAEHLARIVRIAERLPEIRFWIPTREVRHVRDFLKTGAIPDNLTVRISAHMVGHSMPGRPCGQPFSTVTRDEGQDVGNADHVCPAQYQKNACGDCRACWDGEVSHVSYPIH